MQQIMEQHHCKNLKKYYLFLLLVYNVMKKKTDAGRNEENRNRFDKQSTCF